MQSESKILQLPDYIFENYIIPYLSSLELFYLIRPLSSQFYVNVQKTLQINFPEEMLKRLKEICQLNKNDNLTRQFEEKSNKILQERNILFLYSLQLNFAMVIYRIIENSTDSKIVELIRQYFTLLDLQYILTMLNNSHFDELKNYLKTEEAAIEIREKIELLLNVQNIDINIETHVTEFNNLDEDYLKEFSDFTSCVFIYLGKLIEFQLQKINHKQIKQKLDYFFQKITQTSNIWPERKNFFEKVTKFIDNSKLLTKRGKRLLLLFQRYQIESPLDDFIKEKMFVEKEEDDEFEILVKKRKSLTEKISRIEDMAIFLNETKMGNNDDNVIIGGVKYLIPDFLFTISLIRKNVEISPNSFIECYNQIKKIQNE